MVDVRFSNSIADRDDERLCRRRRFGNLEVVDEMYTSPDRRGQGLGSAVLIAAVDEAKRRGATEIEVDEPDTDAHRFHGRHGFPLRDSDTGDRAFILRKVINAEPL